MTLRDFHKQCGVLSIVIDNPLGDSITKKNRIAKDNGNGASPDKGPGIVNFFKVPTFGSESNLDTRNTLY